MRHNLFHFTILLFLKTSVVNAADMQSTYFEIDEKLYPAIDAVRLRGGELEGNNNKGYVMFSGRDDQGTHLNSSETNVIQTAFFPETIMMNFFFKKSMSNASIYINDMGPFGKKLDSNGNGNTTVYFMPRKKEQNIELSKKSKSINATFSIKENNTITCTGIKKLECSFDK